MKLPLDKSILRELQNHTTKKKILLSIRRVEHAYNKAALSIMLDDKTFLKLRISKIGVEYSIKDITIVIGKPNPFSIYSENLYF